MFPNDNFESFLGDSDSEIISDYSNSEYVDSDDLSSNDESIVPLQEEVFESDDESCDQDRYEPIKILGFRPKSGGGNPSQENFPAEEDQQSGCIGVAKVSVNSEEVVAETMSNDVPNPSSKNNPKGVKSVVGNTEHIGPLDGNLDSKNIGSKCNVDNSKCGPNIVDDVDLATNPIPKGDAGSNNNYESNNSVEDSAKMRKQSKGRKEKSKRSGNSERIKEVSIISLNVHGFGLEGKFGWVKRILSCENPDIAVFQETKCRKLEDGWVQSLWRNSDFGFIQKEVIGNSGGMLMIWDTKRFVVDCVAGNEFYLAIWGKWFGTGFESIIVNVYGPHNDSDKKRMWDALDSLMGNLAIGWVLCGDFKEVREESDRLNCIFHQNRARRFNDFIIRNNLIEIPINGRKFTRGSDNGLKFCKLDRFLISDAFINMWEDLSIMVLDRKESDHCPLILRDKLIDFGTKPFKVFDEWLHKEGIDRVVQEGWGMAIHGSRKDCCFKDKLKNVKGALKTWSKEEFGGIDDEINSLKKSTMNWEIKAENGVLTEAERLCWLEERKKWMSKEKSKANMLKQKARIRWILEGDENSKYFHASLKRKYNKCNIRGLNINGCWNENPKSIKDTVFEYFKSVFSEKATIRPQLFNRFAGNRQNNVDGPVADQPNNQFVAGPTGYPEHSGSVLEGHAAGCSTTVSVPISHSGSASSRGPVLCNLSQEEANQLESPFSESEVWDAIKECGSSKAPGLDGFNMRRLRNFGVRILSCLQSASISVLVNGSPTNEFTLKRGVRQGDTLSPFLFILVAEGLNVITKGAVGNSMFKGMEIGDDKVPISLLQYADDTIFFGERSENNLSNLMKLLKCFELTSGLKVNYNKSNLYGVGVETRMVENMAHLYKCKAGSFPFIYLGLPVGGKMNKLGNWNPIIDKFSKRLLDWKARSMSFGGRLTLVKSVLNSLPFSVWSNIVKTGNNIDSLGVVFRSSFVKQIGDGASTFFWNEVWLGSTSLKNRFKRLSHLENDVTAKVCDRVIWDGTKWVGN
ncbi:uncharacterized protein [Rutidosis leptorrhynchoides]|uniref:uncharacterized protein n=1 Tax=Rutidosis leptorrhynchoides TaxID=125765 RepID=UPI003A991B78